MQILHRSDLLAAYRSYSEAGPMMCAEAVAARASYFGSNIVPRQLPLPQ
jgi:hypothetical protein